jgi:glucosamine-6-phosphate deaminase
MKNPEARQSENIVVADSYAALSSMVAQQIATQLRTNPASSLGLPVGKSITGCYDILAQWSQSPQEGLSWEKAKCFALDDYLDVDEAYSFEEFLTSKLYRFTNVQAQSCYNPRFQDNYDQVIGKVGGLDICILGIGRNGHIAFNEPGTPKASWTHCVWLSESTIEANRGYFVGATKPATKAITMGIATILSSRKIILVATGNGKKEILKRALEGPPAEAIPASFLTLHPNLMTVTDFHY